MKDNYVVRQIEEDIWNIDDENEDSAYLVKGNERAILIDTTCGELSIKETVEGLTDRPVEVLLTHAHWDHACYASEFPTIYIHPGDYDLLLQDWEERGITYNGEIVFIHENEEIDLGGRCLQIREFPGHTEGSIVVLDPKSKNMFCGDAIGSGSGVLMAVGKHPCEISKYKQELLRFKKDFAGSDFKMYGGHRNQENGIEGFQDFYNPLSDAVVEDMIVLCDKLICSDEALVWRLQKESHVPQKAYYVSWGKAAMWVTKEQCR